MSKRGGISEFLDDHEEKHAAATGLGLGVAAVASGRTKLLGVGAAVAVQALREKRPAPAKTQDLTNDVRREPHYFLFGVAVGALIGLVVNPSAVDSLPI